jgi:hypothetical protein
MLPLLLALACVQNTLTTNEDVVPGPDDTAVDSVPDTEPPEDTDPVPSCDDHAAPATYAAELDRSCLGENPPGTFTPVVEWSFSAADTHSSDVQVISTPAVMDLDGDTLPEILVITYGSGYRGHASTLRALHGTDGSELWSLKHPDVAINGPSGIAVGDVDGDGHPEVFVCSVQRALVAISHEGAPLWTTPDVCTSGEDMPSIHDLDADGDGEIVVGRSWVDHTGALIAAGTHGRGADTAYGAMSFGADVNGDGVMEIVVGNAVYALDGSDLWSSGAPDGQPAIGDMEGDGVPDLIVTTPSGMYRYEADTGAVVWGPVTFTGGAYGGPPTLADFDGDGQLEFGVAGKSWYVVYEADGSELWKMPTVEGSIAITGASVFDFEGDGAAEVVYADHGRLWVFDGATGAVKLEWSGHSSGTVSEYPLVADVDGDDQAEIVVGHNTLAGSHYGLTVLGDADDSWVDAGRAWNQYAWHISHVADDGSLGAYAPTWTTHNTFRAGKTEGLPTWGLPNLRVGPVDWCTDTCPDSASAYVAIENNGLGDATGVVVHVGDESSTVDLASGETVWLGPFVTDRDVAVVIDAVDQECHTDDNAAVVPGACL